jgi:hypothetical protein
MKTNCLTSRQSQRPRAAVAHLERWAKKMKPAPHEDAYPSIEWIDDFFGLCATAGGKEEEELMQVVDDLFYRNHPDDPQAEEKKSRLVAAYNYFVRHLDSLSVGDAAVFGEQRGLVSQHLVVALYRVFSILSPARFREDFDPAIMLKMVAEQKKLNG